MEDTKNQAGDAAMSHNGKTCTCGPECACARGWGYGRRRGWGLLLRVLIALAILIVVFCIGVKVGEFHSAFSRSMFRGHGMMMSGSRAGGGMSGMSGGMSGAPMMRATTTPSTGASM